MRLALLILFLTQAAALAASSTSVTNYVEQRIDEKQTILSNNLVNGTFVTAISATNIASFEAQQATNGYPWGSLYQTVLGFTPPTNNIAGITNALGYIPLSNTAAAITATEGFVRATNAGPISSSQVTTGLGYTPLTNTGTAIINGMGFQPATNNALLQIGVFPSNVFTNSSPQSFTNNGTISSGTINSTNAVLQQITTTGGTPTITTNVINAPNVVGFAGHPGDTVSISGSDLAGQIIYSVSGSTTTAATAANSNSFAVVTFSKTFSSAPKYVMLSIGVGANVAARTFNFFGAASTTNWVLSAGGNTLSSPSTNFVYYLVVF